MERWEYIPLSIIILCFVAITVVICDAAYHHYEKEHAQEYVRPEGWTPPKIVHFENCALWDEIRHECEDD